MKLFTGSITPKFHWKALGDLVARALRQGPSVRGDRTDAGRTLKLMVVIDEYTRQCLAIHVAWRIRARDAIDVFADLMETHGIPEHIRSDNDPEMLAKQLQRWLKRLGTTPVYITPGSPWENGCCESSNGKLYIVRSSQTF